MALDETINDLMIQGGVAIGAIVLAPLICYSGTLTVSLAKSTSQKLFSQTYSHHSFGELYAYHMHQLLYKKE